MMKIRIRVQAQRDLDAIFDYSIREYGEATATAYPRAIGITLDRLAEHPELGTTRGSLAVSLRSVPVREHRVFYLILKDRVSIVRVLHKAMDVERHV